MMHIILLRLDRIGDFILGVPAYRALRKRYPEARITAVVSSYTVPLAERCPYFDEVMVFDALWLKPGNNPLSRWMSAFRLVRFLRALKADWVVDFRDQSRLDPLVTGLSGARVRAGFARGIGRFLLNRSAPLPSSSLHQVERNLLLLDALGVPRDGTRLEMWTQERDRKTAASHLPSQGSLPGTPRIAVHVGAATPSKRWNEDAFASVLHELYASVRADLFLLGDTSDVPFAHEVLDDVKCPVVNLVGKLSLNEMAAVLRDCQVFVGCDSGSSHIAAACGVPVVCLFSAANEPKVWRPWGEKVKVLTRQPDCAPCHSYQCLRDDGYFCMDEIEPEEVVEAVRAFIS
jgi:ADP-heptose:LPS heptosyltransferase